jgi:C1A family cysteine protease
VKQQGNANSCVAHALGLAYETEQRRQNNVEYDSSEQQLYYDARIKGSLFPKDIGCYPRDALSIALNNGIAPEKLCAYNSNNINNTPDAYANAFKPFFKIKSYHKILNINAVREEIARGHPVIFNIPVYQSLFTCPGEIRLPNKNDVVLGYHEMTIIGYDNACVNLDKSTGAFLIQNSWGKSWGFNGKAWLPYDWFSTTLPGTPAPTDFYSIRLPSS